MSRMVTPRMAAAVSNLGGLGMLAIGRGKAPPPGARSRGAGAHGAPGRRRVHRAVPRSRARSRRSPPSCRSSSSSGAGRTRRSCRPGMICGWQVGTRRRSRAAVDAGCRLRDRPGCRGRRSHTRHGAAGNEFVRAVRSAVDVPSSPAAGSAPPSTSGVRSRPAPMPFGRHTVRRHHRVRRPRSLRRPAGRQRRGRHGDHRSLRRRLARRARARAGELARRRRASARRNRRHDLGRRRIGDRDPALLHHGPDACDVGNLDAMPLYAGTGVDAVTRRGTVAEVMAELAEGWS